MVFLPTARAAAIYHDVFIAMPPSIKDYPVWEIHSRMSQGARIKATDAFREAKRGVLFSSDVTARGIDVKGVTAVVQVGLPSSGEQCESCFLLIPCYLSENCPSVSENVFLPGQSPCYRSPSIDVVGSCSHHMSPFRR